MNLFGLSIGRTRAVSFESFRSLVRQAAMRAAPEASLRNIDDGFVLILDGVPISCNLRNLYARYCSAPRERDTLIQGWISSLIAPIPEHNWTEAGLTLRPLLKDAAYLVHAARALGKLPDPDSLPSRPFAGDLSIVVVREVERSITAVTQQQLDAWGVTFDVALDLALGNMNMLALPLVTRNMQAGSTGTKVQRSGTEVGLAFEGDHLTATWIVAPRFRDYIAQRLQGDYVVMVPARDRLTAIRSNEPALIRSILQSQRSFHSVAYPLTNQCYEICTTSTGGEVSVFDSAAKSSVAPPPGPDKMPAAPGHSETAALPLQPDTSWSLTERA